MLVNGIDTTQLAASEQLLRTAPGPVGLAVRVRGRWQDAYSTQVETDEMVVGGEVVPRGHTVHVDLPVLLGGRDRGPAPGELLLAALSTCVAQGIVEQAAADGITVRRVEVAAEGELDLRGAAGFDGIPAGLTGVRLRFAVDADADAGQLDDLLAGAVRTSPVADSLTAGVALDARVARVHPFATAQGTGHPQTDHDVQQRE